MQSTTIKNVVMSRVLISLLASAAVPSQAMDIETSAKAPALPKQSQSADNEVIELEEMEVIGTPDTLLAPQQSSLKDKALQLQQGDTLGKTLEQELGVSNASFGPGVGLPVVRGLTGSRVRLLQSGIGSHDASSLSPDHAVAIEPLFAEEITVLRGPETIRYGGNAIGGVVDVKDNRIPEHLPKKLIDGALESRYDTNGQGTNSAFKVDISESLFLGKDFPGRPCPKIAKNYATVRLLRKPEPSLSLDHPCGGTHIVRDPTRGSRTSLQSTLRARRHAIAFSLRSRYEKTPLVTALLGTTIHTSPDSGSRLP